MATLGALMSQQLGFSVTASAGTIYAHGLGFTPTVVLLTVVGTPGTGVSVGGHNAGYTLVTSNLITIQYSGNGLVDVLCGSLHSLVS